MGIPIRPMALMLGAGLIAYGAWAALRPAPVVAGGEHAEILQGRLDAACRELYRLSASMGGKADAPAMVTRSADDVVPALRALHGNLCE